MKLQCSRYNSICVLCKLRNNTSSSVRLTPSAPPACRTTGTPLLLSFAGTTQNYTVGMSGPALFTETL